MAEHLIIIYTKLTVIANVTIHIDMPTEHDRDYTGEDINPYEVDETITGTPSRNVGDVGAQIGSENLTKEEEYQDIGESENFKEAVLDTLGEGDELSGDPEDARDNTLLSSRRGERGEAGEMGLRGLPGDQGAQGKFDVSLYRILTRDAHEIVASGSDRTALVNQPSTTNAGQYGFYTQSQSYSSHWVGVVGDTAYAFDDQDPIGYSESTYGTVAILRAFSASDFTTRKPSDDISITLNTTETALLARHINISNNFRNSGVTAQQISTRSIVCYSAFFENTQYTGSNSNILYLLFNTTYIDSGGHVTRDSSFTFIVRINVATTNKLANFPDIYGSMVHCLQFSNPTISGVTYGVSSMLYNSSPRGRAGVIALISDTAGTNKKLLVNIWGADRNVLYTNYSSSFNSTSNALFQVNDEDDNGYGDFFVLSGNSFQAYSSNNLFHRLPSRDITIPSGLHTGHTTDTLNIFGYRKSSTDFGFYSVYNGALTISQIGQLQGSVHIYKNQLTDVFLDKQKPGGITYTPSTNALTVTNGGASVPSTTTPADRVWTTAFPTVSGDKGIYKSSFTHNPKTQTTPYSPTWKEPVKISGTDGYQGKFRVRQYVSSLIGQRPSTPTGGSYNPATGVLTPSTNWSIDPPVYNNQTHVLWFSYFTHDPSVNKVTYTPTWSSTFFLDATHELNVRNIRTPSIPQDPDTAGSVLPQTQITGGFSNFYPFGWAYPRKAVVTNKTDTVYKSYTSTGASNSATPTPRFDQMGGGGLRENANFEQEKPYISGYTSADGNNVRCSEVSVMKPNITSASGRIVSIADTGRVRFPLVNSNGTNGFFTRDISSSRRWQVNIQSATFAPLVEVINATETLPNEISGVFIEPVGFLYPTDDFIPNRVLQGRAVGSRPIPPYLLLAVTCRSVDGTAMPNGFSGKYFILVGGKGNSATDYDELINFHETTPSGKTDAFKKVRFMGSTGYSFSSSSTPSPTPASTKYYPKEIITSDFTDGNIFGIASRLAFFSSLNRLQGVLNTDLVKIGGLFTDEFEMTKENGGYEVIRSTPVLPLFYDRNINALYVRSTTEYQALVEGDPYWTRDTSKDLPIEPNRISSETVNGIWCVHYNAPTSNGFVSIIYRNSTSSRPFRTLYNSHMLNYQYERSTTPVATVRAHANTALVATQSGSSWLRSRQIIDEDILETVTSNAMSFKGVLPYFFSHFFFDLVSATGAILKRKQLFMQPNDTLTETVYLDTGVTATYTEPRADGGSITTFSGLSAGETVRLYAVYM